MGRITVAPNIKKERVFINAKGEEVKPFTNEVVKPQEPEYIPEPVKTQTVEVKPNKIQQMIQDKVEKIVEEQISKALENLLK